jgi:sortase A
MLLGLAMVAGSGWLIYDNKAEDENAGIFSEVALVEIKEMIAATPEPTPEPVYTPEPTPMPGPQDELLFLPTPTPIPDMPVKQLDGYDYIGYLEIPTIGISLPVMSDWSYPQLRVSPCRFTGSAYENTMVIMAHNYDRHFGRLSSLNTGDPVQFVDAMGNIFRYIVAGQETLGPNDLLPMVENDYDLTLFTCTYGGASRVTVRLTRVAAY